MRQRPTWHDYLRKPATDRYFCQPVSEFTVLWDCSSVSDTSSPTIIKHDINVSDNWRIVPQIHCVYYDERHQRVKYLSTGYCPLYSFICGTETFDCRVVVLIFTQDFGHMSSTQPKASCNSASKYLHEILQLCPISTLIYTCHMCPEINT